MKVYLVGGAVRDMLLGVPVTERDWVVVGSTPEAMAAQGYRQVGRDFPVFLHPDTGEEYALARTERKTGPGHTGFDCDAGPDVTLEDDLLRRDLTINAMAQDADGVLIDPFGGRRDLEQRTLRHVSDAFVEDPLRVFRVARFAARLPGFEAAPETLALMQRMADRGDLAELAAERVWQELDKALNAPAPARFLAVLEEARALPAWLPELSANGAGACGALAAPEQRFAALCWGLDHAAVLALCARLKAPRRFQQPGAHVARFGPLLAEWREQAPEAVVDALEGAGVLAAQRDPELLLGVVEACGGRSLEELREVVRQLRAIDAGRYLEQGLTGKAVGEAMRQARVAIVAGVRRDRPSG